MWLSGPENAALEQPADANGSHEKPECGRVATEAAGVDSGEQGNGEREDGSIQVGQECAGEPVAAADETDPFRHRPGARTARGVCAGYSREPGHGVEGRGEAGGVGEVARP